MASVDDRVVRMEFDNAAFEKKIASTLASLAQLDKSLKLTGATKGLTDVSEAANKVHFGGISAGIESVSNGFIALKTVAITTMANITSAVEQAGLRIAKALTLDPVIAGFQEYETQLNAVQTILANTASKGTTLEQVNEALQRLNVYSDQTIYNFGQMAKNIGTFTAAGVDLETSVQSIKGIANLAAMSGSNADQAASAMYQLSQAIATGSLKLIDWNSVVNAGMGGEAFKTALFETGKAMHTLTDVPLSMTFKEWEASGHSFRESLQDEWITANVLTTTLAGFTGDLTEEMLIAKGFSQEAALSIMKTAALAKAAATEVKTFTQLVGTVKEAIGTGWADSFKIIIGNFTEAKALWTSVNNAIGKFVSQNADARNAILQGWKDLGGRTQLIEALKTAFHNLGEILAPIREAFSTIFPPMTAERLLAMTAAFTRFAAALKPTEETVSKLRSIFSGFFAMLSIGWEIISEGGKFLRGLAKELLGIAGPGVTSFLAKLGDGLTKLQAALVKGGGIQDFFANLTKSLQKPIALLEKFKDAIVNLFSGFDTNVVDNIGNSFGRFSDRIENLKESLGNLWKPLENAFVKIADVLNKIWIVIRDWFKELGQKIAATMEEGDFDKVLDLINVGLLGAITALLAKFFKSGFKLDLGGGLFAKISATFKELTGVLKAMQMQIKANALLKIAGAIAILTASVLVLSMIDSVALTKALTAMAIGFGELMATFSAFTKIITGPKAAASFTVMTTGLIMLSTAILILSLAVRSLAKLKPEELTRGLAAIAGLLTTLTVLVKPLAANSKGLVVAGVGITAIAVAMNILAIAMKIFATMSWEEMGKGLLGVAAALGIIAGAMHLMPKDMILNSVALVAIAIALNMLAGAVALFGTMDWETIGKGMVGIAGSLLIIAGAMHLMPKDMVLSAAALILVGIALGFIGKAVKSMAQMSWEKIAKGLITLAGSLLIIAGGMKLMEEALPGALALMVVSVALGIFAKVLKTFAGIPWKDLLKGLAGIAITLTVLGVAALLLEEAIPLMIGLGIALIALGAGFALIGLGAMLLAKALQTIGKLGEQAVDGIKRMSVALAETIPAIAKGLAQGIVEFVMVITDAAPVIAEALGVLLNHIFDTLLQLAPKLFTLLDTLITGLLTLIKTKAPEIIATGFFLLLQLLKGIRDNIEEIVKVVADIIVKFLDALKKEIPRIAQAIADTLQEAFTSAAKALGEVAATLLVGVGIAFIEGFGKGLEEALGPVGTWFSELGGKIFGFIGNVLGTLVQKGRDIIEGLFNGILNFWMTVVNFFWNIASSIASSIPNPLDILFDIGKQIIKGLWHGMKKVWEEVTGWLGGLGGAIGSLKGPPAKDAVILYNNGLLIMQGLHKGMKEEWDNVETWLDNLDVSKVINDLANQMNNIDEFNPTITPVLDLTRVMQDASKMRDYISDSQALTPTFSYEQARTIAFDQNAKQIESPGKENAPAEIRFEQTINAPTQLSTADIYKQTRNQITMAKEELSIP